MSRRVLAAIGWGAVGFAVAMILTIGTFALAGKEIAEPATPSAFLPSPGRSEEGQESRSPEADRSEDPSPAGDDHGGSSTAGEKVDDADDDNSGPGSGDNSGSSSHDNSGSSSDDDNSGSGSDGANSGSGSDGEGLDDHDDD